MSSEGNPQVSWLMVVKNGMPFLRQTLASLAGQTYPNAQILVWENGSTDGTLEELRRWIPAKLPGVIYTDRPLDLGASRAALINIAKTELCAWNDADDISHPERLAKQVSFLQKNPDAALVGAQVQLIDEQDRPLSTAWGAPIEDAEVRWATRWIPKNLTGASIVRRSKIIEAGNYRDNKPIEDHDMLIRLSLFGRLPNLPDTLLQYRRHSLSITANVDDHFHNFRRCAALNADILFPGIPGEKAMQIWNSVADVHSEEPASAQDLYLFNKSTRILAKALGEDPSYFRENAFFKDQLFHLKRRAVKTIGLGGIWRLRQKLVRAHS